MAAGDEEKGRIRHRLPSPLEESREILPNECNELTNRRGDS